MATNFSVGFLDDRSIGGWIDRATDRGKWRGKERLLLFKWGILFDIGFGFCVLSLAERGGKVGRRKEGSLLGGFFVHRKGSGKDRESVC